MLKRVIVGLVGAAVLTGVGLSELNRLRGNECIKHDAVFRVQVLLLKHDVRTRSYFKTLRKVIMKQAI
jgi:sigma54-dependent transcription regulator